METNAIITTNANMLNEQEVEGDALNNQQKPSSPPEINSEQDAENSKVCNYICVDPSYLTKGIG